LLEDVSFDRNFKYKVKSSQIQMHGPQQGCPFYTEASAEKEFTCIMSCLFVFRVVVIDKVTDFILFIGQLSITFGIGN